MIEWVITAVIVLLFAFGIFNAWRLEIRNWNGGVCKLGHRWQYFDSTSQGCRGYNCSSDVHRASIWITYPRVDTHKSVA